jgi:hypothetical protein
MTPNSSITFPADKENMKLTIGDYVEYDGETWEIVDYETSEQPLTDDNYTENATLLLSPRSFVGDNVWVEDYDVSVTNNQQLYFEL